jgi:hypothetical protein
MKKFFRNILTLSSQFLNVILGGDPDMSVSCRAYVYSRLYGGKWRLAEKMINKIFFDPYHCKEAFIRDVEYAKKIMYYVRMIE